MKNKNKEIEVLEKKITPIVEEAQTITIKDKDGLVAATETLSLLNRYADSVKEKKEEITKPLNVAVKAARALFAPLEDKLDTAIDAIRKVMSSYQTELVNTQREEEARIAARIGEGKGHIGIETAVRKMNEIEKADDRIVTGSGEVKFKTVKKFKVIDISKVPQEYLLADEVAIRRAMLAGVEVTGVAYYDEQVPYNTR